MSIVRKEEVDYVAMECVDNGIEVIGQVDLTQCFLVGGAVPRKSNGWFPRQKIWFKRIEWIACIRSEVCVLDEVKIAIKEDVVQAVEDIVKSMNM